MIAPMVSPVVAPAIAPPPVSLSFFVITFRRAGVALGASATTKNLDDNLRAAAAARSARTCVRVARTTRTTLLSYQRLLPNALRLTLFRESSLPIEGILLENQGKHDIIKCLG